jgi:hypothetical protein
MICTIVLGVAGLHAFDATPAQEYTGLVQLAPAPLLTLSDQDSESEGYSASQRSDEAYISLIAQQQTSPSDLSNSLQSPAGERNNNLGVQAPNGEQRNSDALAPEQTRPLSLSVRTIDLSVANVGIGNVPDDVSAQRAAVAVALPDGYTRAAPFKCVHWRPSCISHFPLYFEDAMLERHGHKRFGHLQPLVSGVKFFTTIPLLPYLKTLRPCYEEHYVLGHYRPGSVAPCLRDHLPYDTHAAVVETMAAASFFWAAPL